VLLIFHFTQFKIAINLPVFPTVYRCLLSSKI
jgi:hypothetical protein